ncbi:MAG: hypothetical protein ACI8SE_002163 [Bacteroidia bacterium]|jgi:hypothetical protein
MNEHNITELAEALYNLKQFCSGKAPVVSGNAFIDYYNRTKALVGTYAVQKQSRFFEEKLVELPELSVAEIDKLVQEKDGGDNYILARGGGTSLAGALIAVILGLILFFKDGSNKKVRTSDKLEHIEDIIDSLVHVINHPGFEELYYARTKK